MGQGSVYTCKNHGNLRWFDTKPGGALVFTGAIVGGPNGPQLQQAAYEPGSPIARLEHYINNRNPYNPSIPLDEPFSYERLKGYMQYVFTMEAKGYVFECECPPRDLIKLPDETYEAIHKLPKHAIAPTPTCATCGRGE